MAKDKDRKNVKKVPTGMKYAGGMEENGSMKKITKCLKLVEECKSKIRKNLKVEKLPKEKFHIMNFKMILH